MELKNIESFLKIAEKGSFSEAAEGLNITQPTISARIKQLESEYDSVLFKRINGRNTELTDVGKEIYPYLKDAFGLVQKVETILKNSNKIENNVTIASPNHMGVNIIPELLRVLYKTYPNMKFKVQIEDTKDTIELIKKGEVKFGLGYLYSEEELDDPSIKVVKIKDEENVIVCNPNHHLAKRKIVHKEDLKDQKIIFYNRNKFFALQNIENFLMKEGIETEGSIEINNLGWIKMMVRKGVGITILQKVTVEEELKSGKLATLNMSMPLPLSPVYLIFSPDTPIELMDIVTDTMKKLFEETTVTM